MRGISLTAQACILLLSLASCSQVAGTEEADYLGIHFSYPSGWVVEEVPDMNGVLVMNPAIEKNWQANVFFEVSEDLAGRELESALSDLVRGLTRTKTTFRMRNQEVLVHETGKRIGRLEYSNIQMNTPLVSWEVIVPMSGQKNLFITATSEASLWPKYQQTFSRILGSLELPGESV